MNAEQLHTILLAEDNPKDADLVEATLVASGLDCAITRIARREHFAAVLGQGKYDLILLDQNLPTFDGLSALDLIKVRSPQLPVIFVSGNASAAVIAEMAQRGGQDYILKQELSRLPQAVRQALANAPAHAPIQAPTAMGAPPPANAKSDSPKE